MKGNDLRGGETVRIEATVIGYSKTDQYDFYYAADASNPDWVFITKVTGKGGEHIATVPMIDYPDIRFTLPKCMSEAGCQQVRFSPTLLYITGFIIETNSGLVSE